MGGLRVDGRPGEAFNGNRLICSNGSGGLAHALLCGELAADSFLRRLRCLGRRRSLRRRLLLGSSGRLRLRGAVFRSSVLCRSLLLRFLLNGVHRSCRSDGGPRACGDGAERRRGAAVLFLRGALVALRRNRSIVRLGAVLLDRLRAHLVDLCGVVLDGTHLRNEALVGSAADRVVRDRLRRSGRGVLLGDGCLRSPLRGRRACRGSAISAPFALGGAAGRTWKALGAVLVEGLVVAEEEHAHDGGRGRGQVAAGEGAQLAAPAAREVVAVGVFDLVEDPHEPVVQRGHDLLVPRLELAVFHGDHARQVALLDGRVVQGEALELQEAVHVALALLDRALQVGAALV